MSDRSTKADAFKNRFWDRSTALDSFGARAKKMADQLDRSPNLLNLATTDTARLIRDIAKYAPRGLTQSAPPEAL